MKRDSINGITYPMNCRQVNSAFGNSCLLPILVCLQSVYLSAGELSQRRFGQSLLLSSPLQQHLEKVQM